MNEITLLETMRLHHTVQHMEEHLQRMQQSAHFFGIPFDKENARTMLKDLSSDEVKRLRLLCSFRGELQIEIFDLGENPDPLYAYIAEKPIIYSDMLYHKTTDRSVYTEHTKSILPTEEVILYNEKGELTEFSTGNIVLQFDDQYITPPLSSGLLPGIARLLALEKGQIKEAILTKDDLSCAQAIWHINSLRGWRRVMLR